MMWYNIIMELKSNSLKIKAPHLEVEWHEENTKQFWEVSYASNDKRRWVCAKCLRSWWAAPCNRTGEYKTGCPKCARCSENNSLKAKAPHLEVEWHSDNTEKFEETPFSSQEERLWICLKGHVWWAPPSRRTRKKPSRCPECVRVSDFNSLAAKAPRLEVEWHPDNTKKFHEVSFGSRDKRQWICVKCRHVWWSTPSNRTSKAARGCPRCSKHHSKAELAICMAVKEKYPDALSGQRKLLPSKRLELDIYIPSLKKAIEYDGSHWHNRPDVQERDRRKDLQCAEAGIQLLRISDVEYQADPTTTTIKILEWLSGPSIIPGIVPERRASRVLGEPFVPPTAVSGSPALESPLPA